MVLHYALWVCLAVLDLVQRIWWKEMLKRICMKICSDFCKNKILQSWANVADRPTHKTWYGVYVARCRLPTRVTESRFSPPPLPSHLINQGCARGAFKICSPPPEFAPKLIEIKTFGHFPCTKWSTRGST